MSHDPDRIPVPSNGRGPHPVIPPWTQPSGTPPPAPDAGPAGRPLLRDQTVSFKPDQLAVGFGILAGLLLLVAGARRRRGGSGLDE